MPDRYLFRWMGEAARHHGLFIDADFNQALKNEATIAGVAPRAFFRIRTHQVIGGGRFGRQHTHRLLITVIISAIALYGSINLLGWSVDFPARTESLMWRFAAMIIAIVPAL